MSTPSRSAALRRCTAWSLAPVWTRPAQVWKSLARELQLECGRLILLAAAVHAVLHTVQRVRWMMMIIVLHTRHRAAEARSMLVVDRMPGPVAAVQQSTMPGACQELASITWPHTAYASA